MFKDILKENISKNIKQFEVGADRSGGRTPDERYSSFDYCYNYFQSNRDTFASDEYIHISCLHLGFYLASWGMLRGSSFLLEKSVRHYIPLIHKLSGFDKKIWEIDVDKYTDENIELLLKCGDSIRQSLGLNNKPSDILVTKIMLGVFSNVPAFDTFFCKGLGVRRFDKKSLGLIKNFYKKHKAEVDAKKIYTFDFLSAKETNMLYSKAKLIDMIGFIEGLNMKK